MSLYLEGSVYALAQLGPGFAILAEPRALSPAKRAEIELITDGRVKRFTVALPNGLPEGEERLSFTAPAED